MQFTKKCNNCQKKINSPVAGAFFFIKIVFRASSDKPNKYL